MSKRSLLAATIAAHLAAPAFAADESDVIGLWAVDTQALRSQMEAMLERQVGQLPESQRGAALAMVKGQLDSMVGQMEGEAEFRPDGTVVFTSGTDPETYGTWSLQEDRLRFERDQPVPDEPAYVGVVEGDVIQVRPDDGVDQGPFTLTLRRSE